ncbi:hypothetical protein [Erwinia sp.]|nr:hypothetical protein [Erwinia sp.]
MEKNVLFSVDKSRNRGLMFTVYDGDNYRSDLNGNIVKVASE